MSNYYCKYCGHKEFSVDDLTCCYCIRHPNGPHKGKHALYEGTEKTEYSCENCGGIFPSLSILTSGACIRHPDRPNKGKHVPAL